MRIGAKRKPPAARPSDPGAIIITRRGKPVARLMPPQQTDASPHSAGAESPSRRGELASAIYHRFAPLGGADDLELPPRLPDREPPCCAALDEAAPAPPDTIQESLPEDWHGPETMAKQAAQAAALREQARAGGLRFEAYLPPDLADWLLPHIERGTFRDPSEAVFVILGEHEELEPPSDLRRELLRRTFQAAIEEPNLGITMDEMREHLRKLRETPRPEPAAWRKIP